MSDPHPPAAPSARADQILAAARDAFAEQGYDATSMAEIARRVGVVEGAIYRHVPSKVDLLVRVITAFYEPLIASVTEGVAAIDDPADRLRYLIRRQVGALVEEPLVCRLIVSEARALDSHHDSTVAELNRQYTGLALEAVEAGMATGRFRDDVSATTVRDLVYGSIEHICWPMLNRGGHLDPESVIEQVTNLVLDALEPPGDDLRRPTPTPTSPA